MKNYKDIERNVIFLYSFGVSLNEYMRIAMHYILQGNVVIYPALLFTEIIDDWDSWLNKLTDGHKRDILIDLKMSDCDRIGMSNEVVIVTKDNIRNQDIDSIEQIAKSLDKEVTHIIDTD